MFKLCLVLVAILGLSAGVAIPQARNEPRALDAVLAEFAALIDTDQIALILLNYLFDPEFQVVMQFLFSPEFAALYLEIADLEETQNFISFLEESGLDIEPITSAIREFLFLPPRSIDTHTRNVRAGILGLIDELLALLPREELVALAEYHVENTPEFAALYERMQSAEFSAVMLNLQQHPTVIQMGDSLMAVGVDINLIIDLINENLGWGLLPHPPPAY